MKRTKPDRRPLLLSAHVMRAWALPQPDEAGDKESRGRVLVVGGAPEMPGAVILAATAALRAGAGKLQIATCRSIAQTVGASVPEARVFALPETKAGGIAASAADAIAERWQRKFADGWADLHDLQFVLGRAPAFLHPPLPSATSQAQPEPKRPAPAV